MTNSSNSQITDKDFIFVDCSKHPKKLRNFYICDHLVTVKEYEKIMGVNPNEKIKREVFSNDYIKEGNFDNYPVIGVSILDAIKYCNKRSLKEGLEPVYCPYNLNPKNPKFYDPDTWEPDHYYFRYKYNTNGYRLPLIDEWKYAAKGGKKSKNYKYAGSDVLEEVAWNCGRFLKTTNGTVHPIKQKKPNELGLYDMHGMLDQFCYNEYHGHRNVDFCNFRIRNPDNYDNDYDLENGNITVGFRLVRSEKIIPPTIKEYKLVNCDEKFYISDSLVTQKEFYEIMEINPYEPEAELLKCTYIKSFEKIYYATDDWGFFAHNPDEAPVCSVNWYEAIAYCNKKSIKEGLTPCYKVINKKGEAVDFKQLKYVDIPEVCSSSKENVWEKVDCDFSANGYRLPTTAEWIYAAIKGEKSKKKANDFELHNMNEEIEQWDWECNTHGGNYPEHFIFVKPTDFTKRKRKYCSNIGFRIAKSSEKNNKPITLKEVLSIAHQNDNPNEKNRKGTAFNTKGSIKFPSTNDFDFFINDGVLEKIRTKKTYYNTTLSLPEGITKIGSNLFDTQNIPSTIENIEIPDSVKSIAMGVFSNFTSLKSVNMPKSISEIEALAFANSSIQKIKLLGKLETISFKTFANCVNLVEVKLSNSIKTIQAQAFINCILLNTINFPTKLETIENSAFKDCKSLHEITLPENLKVIEESAFEGSGLEQIVIPPSCQEIKSRAFALCPNLKKIVFPENVKVADDVYGE